MVTSLLRRNYPGFTIVELLIVIVVIAILAAITVVAYNGIQQRAKAASAAQVFSSIDKGLRLLGVEDGRSTWWIDNEFTGTGNPTVQQIITATELNKYVQNPTLPDGYIFRYDNDGDIYNGCSISDRGVKLFSYNIPVEFAQGLDDQVDDGNLSCGKVVWNSSNGSLSYYLSETQGM